MFEKYAASPSGLEHEFNLCWWGRSISTPAAWSWLNSKAIPAQDKIQVLAESSMVSAYFHQNQGCLTPAPRTSTLTLSSTRPAASVSSIRCRPGQGSQPSWLPRPISRTASGAPARAVTMRQRKLASRQSCSGAMPAWRATNCTRWRSGGISGSSAKIVPLAGRAMRTAAEAVGFACFPAETCVRPG